MYSRIDYASSNDGLSFIRRKEVAICPEMDYERYGIEDPRLMTIEERNLCNVVWCFRIYVKK